MNCEKFQMLVRDLDHDQDRDGTTDLNERTRALEHAVACDSCALIWEEERSVTSGLRGLAGEMKSLAAPPQVEARVLAAFRQQGQGAVVRPFPPRQAQRQRPRYWMAAIAALLLIVFAVVVVRSGILSRSRPQFAVDGTQGLKVPQTGQAPDIGRPQPLDQTQKDEAPPSPRRNVNYQPATRQFRSGREKHSGARANTPNIAAASESNTEIATDFFPIGYGTPNLQEGGQLLRVELPRAAVARFGLPVNMERAGERVKADVLVGADGLAQAIRFVH